MSKKILIIDDSEMIRKRLFCSLSEMADVSVAGQASNTRDGYDLFYSLNPDIIILDIQMPGGSGIKLLEKIKQESPETVVIMLTNYPYQAYRQHCEKLGADFFLDKYSEFEKISQLIQG
jgi:DNA-binding NarL/FixJ family response regulator